jgi:hypothetical protein
MVESKTIKKVQSSIDVMIAVPSISPDMLQSMLAPIQEQLKVGITNFEDVPSVLACMQENLKALLMNVHEVPTWLCIYPHKSASMKEKLNPFNLVNNKYDAQCMCEWTHRLSSKVMQFTQPKAWVRINYLSFTFTFTFYLI